MADNAIQFWLSFNNGAEKLRLPVNPETISVSATHGYEDIQVTQLGEFTVIGNEQMPELTFSSFFPRDYNPSYCEYANFPTPWECESLIRKWQTSGKPMRLTITGTPINKAVTLRRLEIDAERAGSPGDIYFTATFKEFRFVTLRKVSEVTDSAGTTTITPGSDTRPNDVQKVNPYIVQAGDFLMKIAARADVYDNADQWRKIYDANADVIGPDPNLIKPGTALVIPA